MFEQISSQIAGPVGRAVIDFYLANHLILNSLVVLYGLILVVAHRNMKSIEQSILDSCGHGSLNEETISFLRNQEEPTYWTNLFAAVKLPIISASKSMIFHRVNRDNVISNLEKQMNREKK